MVGYLAIVESQRIFGVLDGLGGIAFFEFDVAQSLIWAAPICLILCCFRGQATALAKTCVTMIALTLMASFLYIGVRINRGATVDYKVELTSMLIAPATVATYFFALKKLDEHFQRKGAGQ